MKEIRKRIHAVLVAFVLTGCGNNTPTSSAPTRQTYPAKGVVKELDPDGKTVVIQHEAISNYMAAMTMPFEVKDTNELRGLKLGDAVDFQLVVTKAEGWIEHLHKTGEAPAGPLSKTNAPAIQISSALEPLDEGDMLPDYHFTNELGQPVYLSQYKGGALAFTFFFTSCPFPNFCPRMTSNFEEASIELRKTKNAPAQWQLLSISFDPKTDSPERLLNYAKNANYDPVHWSFLTGAPDQISSLADQFGENFTSENGTISHNLRTVVIDSTGRIKKIFVGNTWTPTELVTAMVK